MSQSTFGEQILETTDISVGDTRFMTNERKGTCFEMTFERTRCHRENHEDSREV